eukprot:4858965-Amphidinium_carterae.1
MAQSDSLSSLISDGAVIVIFYHIAHVVASYMNGTVHGPRLQGVILHICGKQHPVVVVKRAL